MRYLMILSLVSLSLFAAGCHFFEDSDEIDECPLNSGYPCACTSENAFVAKNGNCYDGSTCLYITGDEAHGFCAEPCDGLTDVSSCTGARGYGTEGVCWWQLDADEPNYCALFCDGAGMGNCAPGMSCKPPTEGASYSVCVPNTADW